MPDTARAFIDESRRYLREDYRPKIEHALARLDEGDLWWRPNPASNSIGNLILHLCGNIRQWVISGVGGVDDVRQRQKEFAADGQGSIAELRAHLRETLAEVDAALAGLDPADLFDVRRIQGNNVTVFAAVYHAVEHFSTHTGQILYIVKLRTAAGLDLYATTPDGLATPRW